MNLAGTQHLARACLRVLFSVSIFLKHTLESKSEAEQENFKRNCWAPTVTARGGPQLLSMDLSTHVVGTCFVLAASDNFPYFQGECTILHQVLPHAVFCGASSIPSSKVDAWFEAKPLRIITTCYPHDRFRYFHMALLEQSAGMADSYYILIAGWNDLSEDGNKDQETEGVKQGPSDPIWPYLLPSKVKSQIFQIPKIMNLPVIEANLGQVFCHLLCN